MGQDKSIYAFGAFNPNTGELITQLKNRKRSKEFIEFLKYLSKAHLDKKIYLVLDNVSTHKSKETEEFLAKNEINIELVFLPTYSPHLNPIESVWRILKEMVTKNYYYGEIEALRYATEDFLSCYIFPQQKNVLELSCEKQKVVT